MKKIEAIIRPSKLEEIKDALNEMNISGLTISQVMGCGSQKGWKQYYRGTQVNLNILSKVLITIVVPDEVLENTIETIIKTAKTGEIGDGKIFVTNVEQSIRIRTGEVGADALK